MSPDASARSPILVDPAVRRIDLHAVESSLRSLQIHSNSAPWGASAARDPMDHRVVENMVAGYAFVDALVAARVDVLTPGNLTHLLELNSLVLCGTSATRREQYRGHIEATERRF